MQKYACSQFFLQNIMSFLRPKYFFSESLIFALYKELEITAAIWIFKVAWSKLLKNAPETMC